MPYHTVKAGECISSIASLHDHFGETLWNAPENAELKRQRKDPNVLMEGDRVFVPEHKPKQISKASDARYRFRRRGVPAKVKVQFLDEDGQPIANEGYRLDLEGRLIKGATDGDGWFEEGIPPGAKEGKLVFDNGKEYTLRLGYLDPIDSTPGLHQRLQNLGYPCGQDEPNELGPGTLSAVRAYRADQGMSIPDQLDDTVLEETRTNLKSQHYT